MSDESAPDDKVKLIMEDAIKNIKSAHFGTARDLLLSVLGFIEPCKDQYPKYFSCLYITIYLTKAKAENFLNTFKDTISTFVDYDSVIELVKPQIVNDFLAEFPKLPSKVAVDFFFAIKPYDSILEKISKDKDEINYSQLKSIISVSAKCSEDISVQIKKEIASETLPILKRIIENDIKKIEDSWLNNAVAFFKANLEKELRPQLDEILKSINYYYLLSGQLGKQFKALQNYNSSKQIPAGDMEKFTEKNIIKELTKDMHQDLVEPFSVFLVKIWQSGGYDKDHIKFFWDLSISQHQTIIDKFFDHWDIIFNEVSKIAPNDFWETILASQKYPTSALKFLARCASKAQTETRSTMVIRLMNTKEAENRLEFVDTIYEYAKTIPELVENVKNQCTENIRQNNEIAFSTSMYQRLLTNPSRTDLALILEFCRSQEDLEYILNLITHISKYVYKSGPYTDEEISYLKEIIKPSLETNQDVIVSFFDKAMKTKILKPESAENILQWLSSQSNPQTNLITTLFNSWNHIEKDVETLNLIGIEAVTQLLFTSEDLTVPNFIADLMLKCKSNDSVAEYFQNVVARPFSNLQLKLMQILITNIEHPFSDMNKAGFSNGTIISLFINDRKIDIEETMTVDFFKRRVAALLDIDLNCLQFIYEDEPLEENHIFEDGQKFKVDYPLFKSSHRRWKPRQLPSAIIHQEIKRLVEAINNGNEAALSVMLLLPVIPSERDIFKGTSTDWSTILNTKEPLKFVYRINILGNVIKTGNRRDIVQIFKSGCFKQLIDILLNHRGIFTNDSHMETFMSVLSLLVERSINITEVYDVKLAIYKEYGTKEIIWSLIDWVISLNSQHHMVRCIVIVLKDISSFDNESLFQHSQFQSLFNAAIFHRYKDVQKTFAELMLNVSAEVSTPYVISLMDKASEGEYPHFFEILSKCCQESKDKDLLWKSMVNALIDSMRVVDDGTMSLVQSKPSEFKEDLKEEKKEEINAQTENIEEKKEEERKDEEKKVEEKIDDGKKDDDKKDNEEKGEDEKDEKKGNEKSETNSKRPSIFSETAQAEKSSSKHEVLPQKKEEPKSTQAEKFSDEELRQATLAMASKVADSSFISSMYESLFTLVPFVSIPIPLAKELCEFSLSKVAFNITRFIPLPPTLFSLLQIVASKDEEAAEVVSRMLIDTHKHYVSIKRPMAMQEKLTMTKRKGIYNLGCTCYINSSLQFLVRVPEVRDIVLSYLPEGKIEDDWLAQLQLLFARMLYFPSDVVDPRGFIRVFKTADGSPINVGEQMDAAEFIQTILERIDQKISSKPIENRLSGKILHKISSLDPSIKFEGSSKEDFILFPLEVKNCHCFEDSFKIFKLPDTFTGQNQYNADDIGNIDAVRNHYIESVPGTFLIQLKRFDFDLETLARVKLDNEFTITPTLDIAELKNNEDHQIYELTGVIMHTGSASSGHYYYYGVDEDGWFCYNDSRVSKTTAEKVIEQGSGKQRFNMFAAAAPANGYILSYRRSNATVNTRPDICKMPPRVVGELLSQIQCVVLKDIMFSDGYIDFIQKFSETRNQTCYRMLVEFLNIVHKAIDGQKFFDRVGDILLQKTTHDPEFCRFILSLPSTIDIIFNEQDPIWRILIADLASQSVEFNSTAPETVKFINDVLEKLDHPFDYWRYFEEILKPICAYVRVRSEHNEDLLTKLLNIVTVCPNVVDEKQMSLIIKNCNLTGLFLSLKTILERNPKSKEVYSPILMDDDFIDTWSVSSFHAFAFSTMLNVFLRNDEKESTRFLDHIKQQMNIMAPAWFASLFAAACTLDDDLVDMRLSFFLAENSKQTPQVKEEVARTVAQRLSSSKMPLATNALVRMSAEWIEPWLSSPSRIVRQASLSTIYALFPEFPPLNTPPAKFGVNIAPLPDAPPERIEMVQAVFESIMQANKVVIMRCVSCGDEAIAADYFAALNWATFYGQMSDKVHQIYPVFGKNIELLSKISSRKKSGIFALLSYMLSFIANPFAFFNLETLKTFLNALGRLPENNANQYLAQVVNLFFPLIECILQDRSDVVIASNIFKNCLPFMFASPKTVEIVYTLANSESAGALADLIFSRSYFNMFILSRNQLFLDCVIKIMDVDDIVIHFGLSGSVGELLIVHQQLQGRYYEQLPFLYILEKFTRRFYEIKKDEKGLISPLQPLYKVWNDSKEHIERMINELTDSACPPEVCTAITRLFEAVFNIPRFSAAGSNLIGANKNEVYFRVSPEVRRSLAKIRASVLLKLSPKEKKAVDMMITDLQRASDDGLFDTGLFDEYCRCIAKLPKVKPSVIPPLISFLEATEDPAAFVGDTALFLASQKLERNDCERLTAKCRELCVGDSFVLFKTQMEKACGCKLTL